MVTYSIDKPQINLRARFRKINEDIVQSIGDQAYEAMLEPGGWPVDTGRSRAGLIYVRQGLTIFFRNFWDYAVYVERLWFPLTPFIRVRINKWYREALRRAQRGR